MRSNNMLKGRSILLAEDDAMQAVELFDTLSDEGAKAVVSVSELDEALRMAGSHRFDAAILDYRLGGCSVTPLADYLDRMGTPFIIHTGYAHEDAFPGHWRGCRLISKPSAPEKLVLTLAALIRWQRMSRGGIGKEMHIA
ncbi:MAG: response regulator [Rhodomicrobiaceae bacterium]